MTTDARRVEVEKVRTKAFNEVLKLYEMLDADGHSEDCALRCFAEWCDQLHSCVVCVADGEI